MKAALLETLLLSQFSTFVLVLARVGALMATAPIFGNRSAPMQARALLAVAMSLMMTPLYSSQATADVTNLLAFSKLVLSEALLGVLLGPRRSPGTSSASSGAPPCPKAPIR
jgi:flagellar biosynthetic protein FliR